MQKILSTKNSQKVLIEVPDPGDIDSFFVFALQKSGSVMQDKIFEDISLELNIPLISVAKSAFHQGAEEGNFKEEICELFVERGYGFYGFRYFPSYLKNFALSKFKKILLIRDPRDILVSHYFSMKNSHVIPQGEMGIKLLEHRKTIQNMDINEYVLDKAQTFRNIFNSYLKIEDDLLKTFRYEDVVFNKTEWIRDILEFLELDLDPSKIESIAKKQDIFPTVETPNSHIRKVTPGDYKDKLNLATIQTLNKIFNQTLVKYGYELEREKSENFF